MKKNFLSLVLAFTLAMSMAVTGSCSDESVAETEASGDADNWGNEKNFRRIPLENASNFRDLGGYPTENGKVTKWGILYRSNALSDLTSEDWEILQDLGVSTLIDLRSSSELEEAPIVSDYSVNYHSISLMKALDETSDDSSDDASSEYLQSMTLDYTDILFNNIPGMVEVLDVILDNLSSENGSTVFFCTAGKDRAGITAALLLYLCGVSREDIIADYMVSGNYNGWADIDSIRASMSPEMLEMLPDDDDALLNLYGSEPKTISALLDSFESEDIRECLAENGFGEEKQAELVALMTE